MVTRLRFSVARRTEQSTHLVIGSDATGLSRIAKGYDKRLVAETRPPVPRNTGMNKSKWGAAALMVILAASLGVSALFAQEQPRSKQRTTMPHSIMPKEVTLSGTVVDLQYYMTGESAGTNPQAFSRNCIRRGVPAALETENGLIILGLPKGNASKLAQHAMRSAEVRGTLYVKHGINYLQVVSIKALKSLDNNAVQEGELTETPADEPEDEPEEDPAPEPEPEPEPEPDPVPPGDVS
jgi:hypothetical protein